MRFRCLLFFCCLAPAALQAQLFPQLGGQRAGISALTFLKIEVSPRAAALGGAGLCLPADAFAPFVNPAALGRLPAFALGASHTFWAADVQYTGLSIAQPTKAGTFALSLSGLNSGPMPVRTTFQPNGTGELFYAYYLTAGLSYGKQLTEQFSWGATARYVREQLAQFQANTVVADLAFLYQTDFRGLRFGVMIQNFGPNSVLRGSVAADTAFNSRPLRLDAYPAPTVFKLALALTPWESADGNQSLTAMLQLNHPNDNAENLLIAAEYQYRELLFLRAGYKFNVKDQPYPTAGLGLRMRMGRHPLVMDYAFDPLLFLGNVHRVGLSFQLNPVSDSQ
ncbi:MAG: PorV/PorQ family protein [Bacteroidia bacterium]|nr:PorV/PorQ family protein [Bacteroidia bacterium]